MLFGHMPTETGNDFEDSTANWASEGGHFRLGLLNFVVIALYIIPKQCNNIYIIITGKKSLT